MTKDLQELTNKIHTLVPETMELTRGCYVQTYGLNCEGNYWIVMHVDGNKYQCVKHLKDGETVEYKWIDRDMIKFILGHDITLEDVLRAIHQTRVNQIGMGDPYSYVVSVDGTLMEQGYHFTYEPSAIRWHLGKPLHLQSEETIEWLNGIIKVV